MKIKRHHILLSIAIIIALVILPTGTPEDIPTTFLILKIFGWKGYVLLALFSLLLLIWARHEEKEGD